jgi:RNA polymerase sigma-70 factor (ECF subfamily)
MSDNQTVVLQALLARSLRGEEAARQELIGFAYERLRCLARVILNEDFPRLKAPPALLDTTDVVNQAALGMYQALDQIRPATIDDFFRLAAQRIRWLLLDHARKADRRRRQLLDTPPPKETEAADAPEGGGVSALLDALYEMIDGLPERERQVVDLLYFHGLSQPEAAALLGVTERSVRRYWTAARLKLIGGLRPLLPTTTEHVLLPQKPVRP